jgi:hypothetical protein
MDLTILMIFDCYDTNMLKNFKRSKRIEFCGIKDFEYTKDFISFIEYGRLSKTIIETKNIIEFTID